jgi:hypothetical protein
MRHLLVGIYALFGIAVTENVNHAYQQCGYGPTYWWAYPGVVAIWPVSLIVLYPEPPTCKQIAAVR